MIGRRGERLEYRISNIIFLAVSKSRQEVRSVM